MKYILLGPTTGGYSHSLLYFMPGSYSFSDILGFILHTVILVNRLIGNMHVLEGCRMPEFELDIKYSFKGFTSDNGVLYGRRRTVETHSKSLEKLAKAGLNLKQK